MSIFEFVAVAVSIILGLGITRLLSASIDLFRFRKRTRMHWVPITWAVVVFLTQVFFWWQFFGASQTIEVWLFFDFLLTIATVLCLFVASSLVLPAQWSDGDVDLFAFFRAEGRWGIAAYAAFAVIVIAYNNRIYGTPFMNPLTLASLVMAVLTLGVVLGRSRRWVGVYTLLWLAIAVSAFFFTYIPTFRD